MGEKIRNEYEPVIVTHPGTTLAEALEERGMSQAELSERTGRPRKTINEIIRGQTAIMPETAIQLERVLGIPASFWNNRQRQFEECNARRQSEDRLRSRTDWLAHFPVSRMVRFGWIEKKHTKISQMEALLSFFGIGSPEEWQNLWKTPRMQTAFRESKSYRTDSYALSAWLREGEVAVPGIHCAPFDRKGFQSVLDNVRGFASGFRPELREDLVQRCARAGVAVVFVPLIPGVHAWGATRWMMQDKALIQLSLRGGYDDVFWFSFFHEAGHILLHGKRNLFIEADGGAKSSQEVEADAFARDFLIGKREWENLVTACPQGFSADGVNEFARRIGVSPGIVVGRLQHEGLIPHSHLNDLRCRTVIAQTGER